MNDSPSPTPSPQHAVVATHTEKSYKQADGEPDSIAQATAIVRLADVVDECAGKNHKTENPERGGEVEAPQHVAPQGDGGAHESQERTERAIVVVPKFILFNQVHKHLSLCIPFREESDTVTMQR